MPAPKTTDLRAPFDPTGLPAISGADLLTLVEGAIVEDDKGLCLTTADVVGVPTVPNATATTRWQTFLWRRVMANGVNIYVWNPVGVDDPTYLKWQSLGIASIGDGTITGAKLAQATVTDDKIASVNISKVVGFDGSVNLTGVAGGDLTGSYPNPTIGANKVTSTKLSSDAAVDANRAVGADHIKNNVVDIERHIKVDGLTAKSVLRVADDGTKIIASVKKVTEVAEPVLADALKVMRVKSDGSGYELATAATAGAGYYQLKVVNIEDATTADATMPWDDTIPQSGEGVELATISVTPVNLSAYVKVTLSGWVSAADRALFAFFLNAGANALLASAIKCGDPASNPQQVHMTLVTTWAALGVVAIGAQTFKVRWSNNSGAEANWGGSSKFGAVSRGFLMVEEVAGAGTVAP